MQTIGVVGAGGKSGRVFIDAALDAGFYVKAGVLHTLLERQHPNLVVMACDGTSMGAVDQLVAGCDVVVSLIGHNRRSSATVQTDTMRNIVASMQTHQVRRLISLTGTGVRQPGDRLGFFDRIANIAIKVVDPLRVSDGIKHVEVIQESRLDWTVLRVLKLTKTTQYVPVTLSPHGPAELFTSRARVAQAILDVIIHRRYIRKFPVITHNGGS